MASISFDKVNSFRLKYPQYSLFRKNLSSKGEWIELYKNRNELPTAKLRTWVLYHRNDGVHTPNPTGNYCFYSEEDDKNKQLGWIWGFPLFKVGATTSNWPNWSTDYRNENMLIDLSANRNIIVLDFNGYEIDAFNGNAKTMDDIAGNIQENGFYLTLRLKNSQENYKKDFPIWNGTDINSQQYGWATLVEYVYECDIIGPRDMLDLTLDYFLYLDGKVSRLFGEKLKIQNKKFKLAYIDYFEANEYHDSLKISIITGLGPDTSQGGINLDENWKSEERRMDTEQIYEDLIYNNTIKKHLQKKGNNSRLNVTKLIGGFTGEYSSNGGVGWNINSILQNKDGNNGVGSGDTGYKQYNLNNILWCSLNSPRKKRVRVYDYGGSTNFRFTDNYLDLKGNYCNGGGYSRHSNTIDLPRSNTFPYYSNLNVSSNTNTISRFGEFNVANPINYFQDETEKTFNDISNCFFKIYYKLLIPPISGESYKIKYTFGLGINVIQVGGGGGKMTFFRHANMDGITDPPPNSGFTDSNLWAKRNEESIELEWTINDIDNDGNIKTKEIILIDVASGSSKHSGLINITPTNSSLKNTLNSEVENYDIRCNIVQFYTASGTSQTIADLNQNTYQKKIFDFTTIVDQPIVFECNPKNYEPFRYINKYIPNILSINYKSNFTDAPVYLLNESITYNYTAISPSFSGDFLTDSQTINDKIVNPQNTITITDISQSATIINLNRNSTPSVDTDSLILFQDFNNKIIENTTNTINLKSVDNENIIFAPPVTLNRYNYLISDYWRLYNPIVNVFESSIPDSDNITIPYQYLSTLSCMLTIRNISLTFTDEKLKNIKYILINSNENKTNISATTDNGDLATDNIIMNVVGREYLTDELNTNPIIVELLCNNFDINPFGSNRWYHIGNKNISDKSKNGGINLPTETDTRKFSMNLPINEAFSKYNNQMTEGSEEKIEIWNNLYNINIYCWDDGQSGNSGYQNSSVNGNEIRPTTFKVLLLDIPNLEYIVPINTEPTSPLYNKVDYTIKLSSNNSSFEINWKGFNFLLDTTFNKTISEGGIIGKKIEIIWNINRKNMITNKVETIFNGLSSSNLSYSIIGDDVIYTYFDRTVRIYDKYKYIVSGICSWSGINELLLNDGVITDVNVNIRPPSFNIDGFTTPEYFICKSNRFQYGRFNTTSTNLKLYRPLLLRTVGQVDQHGKLIGGDCSIVQNNRPNVLSNGGSNNNIYINTADQMTKKETFKRLSTLRLKR